MDASFSLFLFLLLSSSALFSFSFSFSPVDNYLVDCGSAVDSVIDNRRFVPDCSFVFSSSASISLRPETPVLGQPQIYQSARIFKAPSKYMFKVKDPGTHVIRIHFHGFNSSNFDSGDAQFHVLINKVVALSNFGGGGSPSVSPRVLEYLMWVDEGKLEITFVPASKSGFAFVNAIEVISAPKDLILDTAQLVGSDKIGNFDALTRQALEVVYKVNVGGPKVTPFNDTLWRTWVPDDEYLKSSDGSNTVYFSGKVKYRPGGASREVGPDNVYNTARVIRSKNASVPSANLTWEFTVAAGYKYLVRMHFCDIASISLGLLYFNVYVDDHMAYKDLDLSDVTDSTLASPFYADFVVDAKPSGVLRVSVGPSNSSLAYAVDGILNGVEIMKLNDSMGSLSEGLSADMVLKCWPRGSGSMLFTLIAFVCLLLSVGMVLRLRTAGSFSSVSWSKLPVDVPEVHLKLGKQQSNAMVRL